MIEEPESAALEAHLAGRDVVLATSRIALVEVSRATRVANDSDAVQGDVERLLSSCMLVAVTVELLRAARALASASVRTLDAIHLASALRVQADELLAYDDRLVRAARELGVHTATPRRA